MFIPIWLSILRHLCVKKAPHMIRIVICYQKYYFDIKDDHFFLVLNPFN